MAGLWKKVSANPAKAKWVFDLGILIYVVVFSDTWEIYDFILTGIWTHLGMSSQLFCVALAHIIWEFAWKQVWFHSGSLIHKTIVLSIKIIISLHYWALFPGVVHVFPRIKRVGAFLKSWNGLEGTLKTLYMKYRKSWNRYNQINPSYTNKKWASK